MLKKQLFLLVGFFPNGKKDEQDDLVLHRFHSW